MASPQILSIGRPRKRGRMIGSVGETVDTDRRGTASLSVGGGATMWDALRKRRSGTAAAPGAPAPAPAAPASPAGKPSPWDAFFERRIARADQGVAEFEPEFLRQKQAIGQEYGLTADATGSITADPSNPFSRARLLKESFVNRQRGNATSAAARGQLYSGALQRSQNAAALDLAKGEDANQRAFQDAWSALQQRRVDVRRQADEEKENARFDKLQADLARDPEDPGVEPAAPKPADPFAAVMKKYSGGRWDSKVNADGSRNYRGTNGVLYKIWPDGRRTKA